jgi:hypothetical protein
VIKPLLEKIEAVYNDLVHNSKEAADILESVKKREAAIKAREDRCAGIESAQEVLAQAETVRKNNEAESNRLEEEKIKFSNLMKEERQAVANEATRLLPLQDKEKDLFKGQQALYDATQALEKEKKEWKPRYIAKIKAHFAQSNGKEPNPDDIT